MSAAWQQNRSGTGLRFISTTARPRRDRRLGHQIGHKTVVRVSGGGSVALTAAESTLLAVAAPVPAFARARQVPLSSAHEA